MEEVLQPLQLVLGSTLFYLGLHAVTNAVMIPRLDAKRLVRLSATDRIEVPEKFPSMVNGVIIGFLSCWLIFVERVFEADSFSAWPPALDFFFCSLLGYTLYDLSVMVRQPRVPLDLWVHHVLGLAGCSAVLYFRQGAFFPVAFGMSELTVIPHNLIWLLRRFGDKDSQPYKAALAVRALMFLALRLPALPFAVWYSYTHQGPVPAALSSSAAVAAAAAPWAAYLDKWHAAGRVIFYGTVLNATLFGLLNSVWTAVIVQNALVALVIRKKKPARAARD